MEQAFLSERCHLNFFCLLSHSSDVTCVLFTDPPRALSLSGERLPDQFPLVRLLKNVLSQHLRPLHHLAPPVGLLHHPQLKRPAVVLAVGLQARSELSDKYELDVIVGGDGQWRKNVF